MSRQQTLAVSRSDLGRLCFPHLWGHRLIPGSRRPFSASTVGSLACRCYSKCCPHPEGASPRRRWLLHGCASGPVQTRSRCIHPLQSDPALVVEPQRGRSSTPAAVLAPPTVDRWSGPAAASERSRNRPKPCVIDSALPPSPTDKGRDLSLAPASRSRRHQPLASLSSVMA